MTTSLISETAAHARQRLAARYNAIENARNRPLVLFGCGALGRRTKDALLKAGIVIAAFSDNNRSLWNGQVDGTVVLSPAEAAASFGELGIFVVTIYNGSAAVEQLAALGCLHVLPFVNLYYGLPDILLPWCALEDPADIIDAAADISQAETLWADADSRREFNAQLAWRLGRPIQPMTNDHNHGSIYFDKDLVTLDSQSTFVDCGAFDGDTLRTLLDCDLSFGAYLALEPDPANYAALEKFVTTLDPDVRRRIVTRQCAVSASDGSLLLTASGNVTSMISADGNIKVPAITLDGLLKNHEAGFIKMDIEGSEPDALRGARRTLLRDHPTLAISAYHRTSDIWTIPLLIKSILTDYDLYLRRYAEDCWELVCYAVHPSRRTKFD